MSKVQAPAAPALIDSITPAELESIRSGQTRCASCRSERGRSEPRGTRRRPRNGFTPAIREQLLAKMRPLATDICPFANLPEKREGRWGQGLTLDKMESCQWLQPKLVGQFEFVEWTPDGHLRHVKFAGLREDKEARHVRRE